MKEKVIKDKDYWIKRREEVMVSTDNYKKKQQLEKIDKELWKIGVVFFDSNNHNTYRKKVEDANDKAKERKTTENFRNYE